jgi:hypothetical protein
VPKYYAWYIQIPKEINGKQQYSYGANLIELHGTGLKFPDDYCCGSGTILK